MDLKMTTLKTPLDVDQLIVDLLLGVAVGELLEPAHDEIGEKLCIRRSAASRSCPVLVAAR